MPSTLMTFLLLLLLLCGGCVHTYPERTPADPTLLNATLLLSLNSERPVIKYVSGDTKASSSLRRFVVNIHKDERNVFSTTIFIPDSEAEKGNIPVEIPASLQPASYQISIWSDLADLNTRNPIHYDATNLREITFSGNTDSPILPEGHSFSGEIDLRDFIRKESRNVTVPITLDSPVCLVKVVADDTDRFLSVYPDASSRPGEYSAELTFSSHIPVHYDALRGYPLHYSQGLKFSTSLFFPDSSASTLIILPVFADDTPSEATATLTILNSARVVLSRTPDIPIPIAPGHLSVVSGSFLSNFLSKPILIDNRWENEIIVDIPTGNNSNVNPNPHHNEN